MRNLGLADIPSTWESVTAEWIGDALTRHFPGLHVGSVALTDQTKGNNRRARFRVIYDNGIGPNYLFAKAEGDFRQTHAANGNLFNEPELFASGVEIPVSHPRPYKVIMDKDALDYVIVMEDVTERDGVPLTAESTMSLAQVRDGVLGLARLHSLYWDVSPETHPALAWLRSWEPTDGFTRSLGRAVPEALAGTAGQLPEALDRYGAEDIVTLMVRCMTSYTCGPQTLLHGDAHIGNTFLLPGDEVGFLDWQVARRGNWSQDLGYFFVSALSIEDRRAHEMELLEIYLDALSLTADRKPSKDEARVRYAASMTFALPVWLATFNASVTQTPAGSLLLCKRYASAFVDLDAPAALDELGV